jgi:hypothetical protein
MSTYEYDQRIIVRLNDVESFQEIYLKFQGIFSGAVFQIISKLLTHSMPNFQNSIQ